MFTKKGFSLLEILIVLALTSVFLLVSLGSFKKIQEKIIINSQLETILSQIELSRIEAVAANADAILEFNGNFFCVLLAEKTPLKIMLGPGFSLLGPKLGFTFDGNTKYAGTAYLYYLNKQRYKIILAPATGLLRSEKL